MAREDNYKGYSINANSTSLRGSGVCSIFHVYRDRGEHRECVHTGVVSETFISSKDAYGAAYAAACAWIDEHGQQ
jgi:hypothetical protein